MKKIRGAGGGGKGGGGGGRAPVEAPDSLRSIAYASVLDLVSEGEIEGLVNGLQSVYFNETPLQNSNGTFNFTGATVFEATGTQAQSYIPGFADVRNEIAVGVEVTQPTSVTRQITDANIDAVSVRISIPALARQDTATGDINGTTVRYAIDVQSNGGGFVPQILGAQWQVESATVVSNTLARTTVAASQMRIAVRDTFSFDSNNVPQPAIFSVEYKKISDTVWRTDGINITQNIDKLSPVRVITSLFSVDTIFTTPPLEEDFWEMRLVITSGIPQIFNAEANVGTPFATITGKTTSKYERSHRIELFGEAPWDIRVRRLTADSTSAVLQDKTFWESYTEIIDGKFRYPNSALLGVRIDASQFQAVPRRAYDLKLLRIRVPSNYNPETREYTGIFDGTFKIAWSDNPAWCFYDLITSNRYGLGDYIPEAQVDKYTLYAIGRYCDELVPDGFGGTEPRFTCNLYLQTREEAFNVVNVMASIFRGMPYWANGALTLGFDAPADPVYQFTNANVVGGRFSYAGSALKARHSVALVTWNDPTDFYRQKVEYVEDANAIALYGIVEKQIAAIGCTSQGQAHRVGRWVLLTEQTETEVVTFQTGLEGFAVSPSQIIQVADEARAGTRKGGRIVAATATTVTLDAPTTDVGEKISFLQPNGELLHRTILAVDGNEVTVATMSVVPQVNSIYVIETSQLKPQLFRVLSAVEGEGVVEITALAHNPSKYGAVEEGLQIEERPISVLSAEVAPPQNIVVSESLYEETADILVLVNISWEPVPNATSYIVTYRVDERNYITLPSTSATSIDIRDALEGVYDIRVQGVNALGRRSLPTNTQAVIYGKSAPPQDVTGFSVNIVGPEAHFTWNPVPDVDLSHYKIRYSSLTVGATYSDAIDLIPKISRPATFATAPAMTGTYFIKSFDKSGIASINAAEIVTLVDSIEGLNVVEITDQHPDFAGVKTGTVAIDGKLQLDTSLLFDDKPGLFDDAIGNFDGGGGNIATSGEYEFDDFVDLGNVYTSRVTAEIVTTRIDYVNTFDSAEGLFDSRDGDFDGDVNAFDDVNVEFYVAITDDDPAGTPTWSDWQQFFVGDYTARAFKFKVVLTSSDPQATPAVSVLSVEIDMPDRVTSGDDIASGTDAGGKLVTFNRAFKVAPALGIAAQNLQQGDFYEIITKTPSGFTIRFKDLNGNVVNRTFDFTAAGYGSLAI
jgi:predicted phage tail protein